MLATRFLASAALLFYLPGNAEAKLLRGAFIPPNPPPACPQTIDNGCAASPGGNYQVATFFTGYTGTTYAVRPNANMCGIDYACGMPATSNGSFSVTLVGVTVTGSCGTATMQDPKTASTGGSDDPGCGVLPAHCTYAETVVSAQLTVPSISCSGTSNDIVLRGFNLGPVGGHGSTYFFFASSHTGKKIVAFNNMVGDTSVYYQNAFGSFASASTGSYAFFANNMYGKWLDSFSQQGSGTCSISGATMICDGSETGFAVGQYVRLPNDGTCGTAGHVACGSAISFISGHTYMLTQSSTISAQAMASQFMMASGIGTNTCGDRAFLYNAVTQVNGRIATSSCVTSGGPVTVANLLTRYNYVEGGIYTFGISHWEMFEDILAGGQNPITYTNLEYTGNTIYQPTSLATASTTAAFYISTGSVPAPTGASFIATYTNPSIVNNVIAVRGVGNSQNAIATWDHGVQLTNLTETGNYIDKTGATNYNLCNGNPRIAGSSETSGPVSFFTASSSAVTNKLTVSAFAGGTNIVFDGSNYVGESRQQILSQDSGTAGQAGVYSTSGGQTLTSRSMRSAYPAITNTPTISGNFDLPSGSPISTANMISRTLSTNPCVYPGMQ